MALNLQISATEKNNSFLIQDCTGRFGPDNQGGYGGKNYNISEATKATLYIQTPQDTQPYPNQVDVTGFLPNIDETTFEIYASEINQTGAYLVGGKYKFKIEIVFTVNGIPKTVTGYSVAVFSRGVECCVDSLTNALDKNAFATPEGRKKIELSTLMDAALIQIKNGLYDEASTNIEYVQAQCNCPGC